jgi:8-oxo-dGTP diphosphatase
MDNSSADEFACQLSWQRQGKKQIAVSNWQIARAWTLWFGWVSRDSEDKVGHMEQQFHLLGRAVIRSDNKVLLARALGYSNTFLPGGHVEIGESIPVAIARELQEELGCQATVGRYLGAVEASFESGNTINFEINHLFEVTLADSSFTSQETHLEFFWAEVSELSLHNLQPQPLIEMLVHPRETAFWSGLQALNSQ